MRGLSVTTLRELLRLSLPIVVSQGAFAAMVFTDRLFSRAATNTIYFVVLTVIPTTIIGLAIAMMVVKPGNAPMNMPRTRPKLIISSVSRRKAPASEPA